jgi:hypothetical protein
MSMTKSPTRSSVGPKPRSSVSQNDLGCSSGSALTTTSSLTRDSKRSSSAKDGRTVSKLVEVSPSSPGGYVTSSSNSPWMSSPFERISATFPSSTCSRKTVYGTSIRPGPPGKRKTISQLTARSTSRNHQNRLPPGMAPRGPVPFPSFDSGRLPSTRHGVGSEPRRSALWLSPVSAITA